MQPIIKDDHNVLRFKENKIVRDLLDFATPRGFGLNEIAMKDYSREDRQQLAQLIGYSLSGYGDLRSYVDDEAYAAAESMAMGKVTSETEGRLLYQAELLANLRKALREPMADLFEIHPDDLTTDLGQSS